MISRQRWVIPTAFTLLFWIGVGLFHSPILLIASGLSILATVYALWLDFAPKSKYDLKELRDLADREELANLDPDAYAEAFDSFLCVYCDTVYSTEFKVCPKCGRGCN